ncbi:hypothetical protein AB0F15_05965 [Amycolatopsis sp. NPDC026612]|uniref:hypothetical protein n=1 Tax=Amycolatopsis sp. NPDC026612 TaxID=3155466 RepID=UPI0033D5B73D
MHEVLVLVGLDTFIQTQEVSGHRFGSRTAAGANTKHQQTKRSHLSAPTSSATFVDGA